MKDTAIASRRMSGKFGFLVQHNNSVVRFAGEPSISQRKSDDSSANDGKVNS